MVRFEDEQLIIEQPFKIIGRTIKVKYEDIERVELSEDSDVLFCLKGGKVRKVSDPGIVMYYPEFGEMLKKYRIPYSSNVGPAGDDSIETVREKAAACRETAAAYLNRSVKEKLGAEYEFEAKIVENIMGTSLEFRLLKNGVPDEDANEIEGSGDESIVDELDIAYLSEWEPMYERGKYLITEEASDLKVCEEYLESDVLGFFYDSYGKDKLIK